jgi:hypothetical protein
MDPHGFKICTCIPVHAASSVEREVGSKNTLEIESEKDFEHTQIICLFQADRDKVSNKKKTDHRN